MTAHLRPVCIRCHYDLRGLARESLCPECGNPVSQTHDRMDLLQKIPSTWLVGLRIGCWMVMCGIGLMAIMIPTGGHAMSSRLFPVSAYWIWISVEMVVNILCILTITIGGGLMGRREPGFIQPDPRYRLFSWGIPLSVGSLLPLQLLSLVSILNYARFLTENFFIYMACVTFLMFSAFPFLLMTRLQQIAKRIGTPHIARHAPFLGGTLSVVIITLFLSGLADHQPLYLLIIPVIAALIASIWSFVMLIRCTRALSKITHLQKRTTPNPPTTNNQQPMTNNQQPMTNNQ